MNLNILTVLTFLITCLFVSLQNPVCASPKSQSEGLKQTLIIFSSIKTFVVLFSSLSRFFLKNMIMSNCIKLDIGRWLGLIKWCRKKLAAKSSQLWEMINGIHWVLTTWSHKWVVCTSNCAAEAESFLWEFLQRFNSKMIHYYGDAR